VSLQRVLFGIVAIAMLAALIPGGIAFEHRMSAELEQRSREDMARMPRVLAARQASASDAMMMWAKELAAAPGLAAAVARGDRVAALRLLESARGSLGDRGVLITPEATWQGPFPGAAAVNATRSHKMPVTIVSDGARVHTVAIAPLELGSRWVGAAGVSVMLDSAEAGILAGLTRADVVVTTSSGQIAASTRRDLAQLVLSATASRSAPGTVHEVVRGGRRLLVALGTAGSDATVYFVRDLDAELAIVPRLHRLALSVTIAALVVALSLGALLASALARPAQSLATAADRLAAGDFDAPIRTTRVYEFDRLGRAFKEMRRALARRVTELEEANRELADRQRRLAELQGEVVQRDRLATAGQLVTHLAHEIRNPVANVRNCLELLRRRLTQDQEGSSLVDMATDELLRMHELAERVLDLHRPSSSADRVCDASAVARNVAMLTEVGTSGITVTATSDGPVLAAIPTDSLKQVLLTVMQNAREAIPGPGSVEIATSSEGDRVVIEVADSGPGIPATVLPRIFDPFFTTKRGVQGVGLGLFIAEGIVRSHGGAMSAANAKAGGARFRIELPAVPTTPSLPASESRARVIL
jgi:two-component system, NtrC family, sensor kinase